MNFLLEDIISKEQRNSSMLVSVLYHPGQKVLVHINELYRAEGTRDGQGSHSYVLKAFEISHIPRVTQS